MTPFNKTEILSNINDTINQHTPTETDGKWLEKITAEVASSITDWDVSECYQWKEWGEKKKYLPHSNNTDTGIDAVAIRKDEKLIAIQCKARKISLGEEGNPITLAEVNKFLAATSGGEFTEIWIVTNGAVNLSNNLKNTASNRGLKIINLSHDVIKELESYGDDFEGEKCEHCKSNGEDNNAIQTKNCMQNEAVKHAVEILKKHAKTTDNGIPKDEARGRVILPCGTGKTRISLRIVEQMTKFGEIAIILCPSIALVAQIRREYLMHAKTENMRTLSVCSDATAGNNNVSEEKIASGDDPTIDNSNAKQNEIKGDVTTDVDKISDWIKNANKKSLNVIFGTYQSSYKIGESLIKSDTKASILIADEAHRTAGLAKGKQKDLLNVTQKSDEKLDKETRIKNFGICHDSNKFPVKYRVYQTATPKIYNTNSAKKVVEKTDYYIRSMDSIDIFGVELYRRTYQDAVYNGWLTDYRIIAIGVRDESAYDVVNKIAKKINSKTSAYTYLKGLALAMSLSGAAQQITYQGDKQKKKHDISIKSCIAFLNTVAASKDMAEVLQTDEVKEWLREWWEQQGFTKKVNTSYTIQHLDAKSNVLKRDEAKKNLMDATDKKPFAVTNVGIFGEGTDAPALSAISFLEPRKSPIDVIQAVGRAMRKSQGKKMGYIIVPVVIPSNSDAETHLSTSEMNDGWQELGQVLLALRAHDSRIEEQLSQFLHLYPPMSPKDVHVAIVFATPENPNLKYAEYKGDLGKIDKKIKDVISGKRKHDEVFNPLNESAWKQSYKDEKPPTNATSPSHIITVKKYDTGEVETRIADVIRDNKTNNKSDNLYRDVVLVKCKKKALNMINNGDGNVFNASEFRKKQDIITNRKAGELLALPDLGDIGENIKINLLTKSGLCQDKVIRDLNLLENIVKECSYHLKRDKLGSLLDKHFGFENLEYKKNRADSCTVASLLLVNAAMLHQRIANGKWLKGIKEMKDIKNETNIINKMHNQWADITVYDFVPVIQPALMVIRAIQEGNITFGLQKSLSFVASEVQHIAETYANMGADHAGPLFNKVMGDQASDGAFFTRPVAASLAAKLTLDVSGKNNWLNPKTWTKHKSIDIACGSGTFLAALLSDMKRRAKEQGADETEVSKFHKLAVEDVIHGLDINPISLQLAASQLTASNHDVRFKHMQLYQMPYGVDSENPNLVSAGTLELLGQSDIIPQSQEIFAENRKSKTIWDDDDRRQADTELEKVVKAAKNSRIVIMNPPFTNRKKMGEKFTQDIQERLRKRIDYLHDKLEASDKGLKNFADKNSIGPLFTALADACVDKNDGIITIILPTIALTGASGLIERKILADRFHIHTIITSHAIKNINMSQNTSINESIIIMSRDNKDSVKNTRIINLDKMPQNEEGVASLYNEIHRTNLGDMNNGWGNISESNKKNILQGDWSKGCFRCDILADAIGDILNNGNMLELESRGAKFNLTYPILVKSKFKHCDNDLKNSFPILDSKSGGGVIGQKYIKSTPDTFWMGIGDDGEKNAEKLLNKSGYLLITSGQDISSARLTAVASDKKYVGRGWSPLSNIDINEAKGLAVFLNSTIGRLQFLRIPSQSLHFPIYAPSSLKTIMIPDLKNKNIYDKLEKCWELTKDMEVPQYRDGECEVRQLWDRAVCDAIDLDYEYISKLRNLLHKEPIVRGKSYGEYIA